MDKLFLSSFKYMKCLWIRGSNGYAMNENETWSFITIHNFNYMYKILWTIQVTKTSMMRCKHDKFSKVMLFKDKMIKYNLIV